MTTTHTPLPWKVKHIDIAAGFSHRSDRNHYIESVPLGKKGFVANVLSVRHEKDAAYICKCVNSHEMLVGIVNEMLNISISNLIAKYGNHSDTCKVWVDLKHRAREVIKSSEVL